MAISTDIASPSEPFFKFKSIDKFFPNFIQVALALGSLLALVWLIWGGIEFIMSGGNKEKTKGSSEKITQAIFGLAALAAAWILWRIVVYFLGISGSAKGTFKIDVPAP